nr:dyslexia susceptibility 1 candidate 1 [Hymenolepis microstoma]
MKIRQLAIAEVQAYQSKKSKNNREEKRLGEKSSLQAMMKIEGDERNRFEQIKKEATVTAMQELVALQKAKRNDSLNKSAEIEAARAFAREYHQSYPNSKMNDLSKVNCIVKSESKLNFPIRNNDKIIISFTPRIFPTPERESTKEDEEKWLQKQAEHRRILASKITENDDLSSSEMDPNWLQKKAISLFKTGDYETAAFALSEAIKLAPKMHSLYLNRSACHIQTRNFFRALEDASTALDLLTPPVPQNLNSRVKAHVRRGVAFCNLQMFKEGVSEYEAATKLNPNDSSIQEDLTRLKELMKKRVKSSGSSDS